MLTDKVNILKMKKQIKKLNYMIVMTIISDNYNKKTFY